MLCARVQIMRKIKQPKLLCLFLKKDRGIQFILIEKGPRYLIHPHREISKINLKCTMDLEISCTLWLNHQLSCIPNTLFEITTKLRGGLLSQTSS